MTTRDDVVRIVAEARDAVVSPNLQGANLRWPDLAVVK